MRQQVVAARAIQRRRFADAPPEVAPVAEAANPQFTIRNPQSEIPNPKSDGTTTNATMSSRQVRRFCKLDAAGESLLKQAMTEMGLSARAHDKVLRIARTIADLEAAEAIAPHHLAEAIQYRRLDRRL
jgi:magnesium chelatase family protein